MATVDASSALRYTITPVRQPPPLEASWDAAPWCDVPTAELRDYWDQRWYHRRDGTMRLHIYSHRPRTRVKLVHDSERVYVSFCCDDQYVRSIRTGFQSAVYNDSCVEWFVEPAPGRGYFNFELNAGGSLLLYHIPTDGHHKISESHRPIDETWLKQIEIYHSLPQIVEPEITDPVTWWLAFSVPFDLFEAHVGPVSREPGAAWRCNFQKCAPTSSHPHFATWSPIPDQSGFHRPEHFAPLNFG